jgi:hypothetical protein
MVGPPTYLVESRLYDTHVDKGEQSVLVGHCRSKTVGEISVKNAHPFDFPEDGIIGVHNGTLHNHRDLDTYDYNKVDSEVLYGHMAKNGVRDTFENVEGAFACIWWNDKDKTLNFFRNDKRPLFFTWSKDHKVMFWASEIWMFAAAQRKIDLWDGGEDKKVFHELPVNTLWSFKIDLTAKDKSPLVMAQPEEIKPREKKPYTPAHATWTRAGDGRFERDALADIGGEVPDPFGRDAPLPNEARRRREEMVRRVLQAVEDPLDDPVPWAPLDDPNGTVSGTTNSTISNVAFLKSSVQRSALKTDLNNTTVSKKTLLSLPLPGSKTNLSRNSGGSSVDSESSSKAGKLSKSPLRLLSGVSLRTVAGIQYINDNASGVEYSYAAFMENTNGECHFCKEGVDRLDEVGEFIDRTKFICRDCLKEPKVALA